MTATGVNETSLPYKVKVPGNGSPGVNGKNAYTVMTASFTQPAVGANVLVDVENSDWIAPQQIIFVDAGGYYEAISFPSSTQVVLRNLGYSTNALPTVNIPNGGAVSPGGLQGPGQELSFGNLFTIGASGALNTTTTYFDINGVVRGSTPNGVMGGLRINNAQVFDTFAVTFPNPIVDSSQLTISLLASTNNGQTYAAVTGAVVVLTSSSPTGTATFGPTSFPAGTLFLCSAQVTVGTSLVGGLSTAVSRS